MIKVGDKYKDYIGEVKIMAVVEDKYIVARRKRCVPFLKSKEDFLMVFEKIESKEL